jgi:hypothetical protein
MIRDQTGVESMEEIGFKMIGHEATIEYLEKLQRDYDKKL